jgi:mersacidin/lichenicidin family type 2 lantibiotic
MISNSHFGGKTMRKVDVIRAWKDEEYRQSLTEEERAQLPPHPAGLIELSEAELAKSMGAGRTTHNCPITQPRITCLPIPC